MNTLKTFLSAHSAGITWLLHFRRGDLCQLILNPNINRPHENASLTLNSTRSALQIHAGVPLKSLFWLWSKLSSYGGYRGWNKWTQNNSLQYSNNTAGMETEDYKLGSLGKFVVRTSKWPQFASKIRTEASVEFLHSIFPALSTEVERYFHTDSTFNKSLSATMCVCARVRTCAYVYACVCEVIVGTLLQLSELPLALCSSVQPDLLILFLKRSHFLWQPLPVSVQRCWSLCVCVCVFKSIILINKRIFSHQSRGQGINVSCAD